MFKNFPFAWAIYHNLTTVQGKLKLRYAMYKTYTHRFTQNCLGHSIGIGFGIGGVMMML